MTHANYIVFDDNNNVRLCEYNSHAHQIAFSECMDTRSTHYVLCLHDLHLSTYKYNLRTKSVEIE